MLENYFIMDNLSFKSDLYGGKTYRWLNKEIKKISHDSKNSPILTDDTGNRFYLKRSILSRSMTDMILLKKIIKSQNSCFANLPIDIIEIPTSNEEFIRVCDIVFERAYDKEIRITENPEYYYGFLYPEETYPLPPTLTQKMISLRKTYQTEGLKSVNWKKKEIQAIALGIVETLDKLNDIGYCYYDFNQNRFFVCDDNRILVDFTDYIANFDDGNIDFEECDVSLSPEYRPVHFGSNVVPTWCRVANYSLCALLFHLFFSKFPYEANENPIIENDENKNRYYDTFRKYYQNPKFVFSDEVKESLIYEEDKQALLAWKECPSKIAFIFEKVLSQFNEFAPYAHEWIKYLEELKEEIHND